MFKSPNISISLEFLRFPGKQLSANSALMGGQFPAENCCGAFKNPIFYAVAAVQTAPKNELSFLMVQNTSFCRIISQKIIPNSQLPAHHLALIALS
jgi:hypothetical protein